MLGAHAAAVRLAQHIHAEEEPGGVLVFLTGQDEIDRCVESLEGVPGALPIPLHGKVEEEDRLRVPAVEVLPMAW